MRNKTSEVFECTNCGAQSVKWSGRCLECGKWGTVKQGSATPLSKQKLSTGKFNQEKFQDFSKISTDSYKRLKTNLIELDRLFGGGIVLGSLLLIGGEPGIGKSTLMLQILKQFENSSSPLLYISGEESGQQVKLRADRLNLKTPNLKFLAETNVEEIQSAITSLSPQIAIIDSIQTMYSNDVDAEAGSISQVRACTVKLMQLAKTTNIPIIITGHVTKDGSVSGPKTLEHLVDLVAYLEGDKYHGYRVLRTAKNRFGSTNEIAIFEMTEKGLIEVKNPAKAFLQSSTESIPGASISCFAEGSRAFLVEIQALVSPVVFGYPQRKTSGFSINRLQMLSAVISKRASLNLNTQDIHLNIVGGFKIKEPALDLAVCAAIISAAKNRPIDRQTVIIGEIGLGGEVRSVQNLEKRLSEAEKLNFTTAIIPDIKLNKKYTLNLIKIKTINELPILK